MPTHVTYPTPVVADAFDAAAGEIIAITTLGGYSEPESGLRDVLGALTAALDTSGRDSHDREQVTELANQIADTRLEGEPDTGLRDAINLLVNAGIGYLDGTREDLAGVARSCYSIELDTILGWIADA